MAIVVSSDPIYKYSGLSTDIKPTDSIKDGSTFWETDTGKEYEWRGTAWVSVTDPNSVVGVAYDYIELGYTGTNLTTIKYRQGGVSGTIVRTLTLSYTGANLTGIVRL